MDRRATEGTLLIELGDRLIEYRFIRRRRRTIGISIDSSGLCVCAPMRAPWRDIEAFLHQKQRWIVRKLDEWARLPRPARVQGRSGESLPLFGAPVTIQVNTGRRAVQRQPERLLVTVPAPHRAVKVLIAWLKSQALEALAPRAAHFAARLDVAPPSVRLSSARTQWGVCTEEGTIRLSWRLVHLEPALADYVVAHEVAHLVELNHSERFWSLLGCLYPDWRPARHQLELAGASLPIFEGAP